MNKDKKWLFLLSNKSKNIFLLFIIFATLLASTSVLCYIIFFPDKTAEVTLNNTVKKAKERELVAKKFIDNSKILISTVANSKTFKQYINSNEKIGKNSLNNLFLTLLKSQKSLMQIRYIDKNGMEKIRVSKNNNGKSSIDLILQNKSNRYYFADSKTKQLGKIWFSAIDLNIENGKIEIPYKPTLRVILPLSKNGKFNGIIIVNYYVKDFLDTLLHMPLYDVILADNLGYPIFHYQNDKSWGFYKKNGKYNIAEEFPKTIDKILSTKTFTSTNFTSRELDVSIKNGLILILKLKDEYLQKAKNQEYYRYLVLFIITFIVSAFFSVIVVGKFSDVLNSLKKKNNDFLKELLFDSLTGLKNRRSIIQDMKRADVRCAMLLDIQSFSEINDLYGEKAGDILLQKFTDFLITCTGNCSGEIYRLHGNTFALLNTDDNCKNRYMKKIELILNGLGTYDFSFTLNGTVLDFIVNIKIGFATSKNSNNLLENADMALNYAKKTNKDYIIYNPDLEIEKIYQKDIDTIKIIKKALDDDRIVPYFQPLFKKDGTISGYESLIRLVLEDGTVLTPYHFLEMAKRTRLYFALTKRMIEKSFEIFHNLPYNFSINLSYLDIKNPDTIDFIQKMFDKYNIKNQLTIELLESDTFGDYATVMEFLKVLKDMNIRIAVDDFGSGYSNFSHLIKLNPDYIKIDGSLIKDMDTNEKSFEVVKSIVNFAKNMDMTVVAEFIHSKSVYEKAQSLGIHYYQGFLLGKPKKYEDVF